MGRTSSLNERLGAAAEAAVDQRSTHRLRRLAGAFAFGAVAVTLPLAHPQSFPRWPVVAITAGAWLSMVLLRRIGDGGWQTLGPVAAVLWVLTVIAMTGGAQSVYVDLVTVLVAATALTRTLAASVAVVGAAAAGTTLLGVLADAPRSYFTDVAADGLVWLTIAVIVHQQSAGLRWHARDLDRQRRETERLLAQERRVSETLRELEATREAIARNVTHELRTPLTVIRGAVELFTRREVDDAHRVVLASAASRNVTRLEHLLADIESAFVDGPLAVSPRPTPLDRIVDTAAHGVRLGDRVIKVSADVPTGNVDHDAVARALRALLLNVEAHTPANACVTIRWRAVGSALTLEVGDDGDGWDAANPDSLLEPFQQGVRARTSASPGTGIGLSVVARIAAAHGGQVSLGRDPELGGAVVRVSFPEAAPTPTHRQRTDAERA